MRPGESNKHVNKTSSSHNIVGKLHDHPTSWRRYVYSTNHKEIETM